MNDSLRLSVPDLGDPDARSGFFEVADAAADVDGHEPFNEQARFDVEAGRRTPIVATAWSQDEHRRPVGAAIIGRGELDLVIHPLFRGKGYGEIAVRGLLSTVRGPLAAWSHGDHPAARILAAHHGFEETRALFLLRLSPIPDVGDGTSATGNRSHPSPDDVRIEEFRVGLDDTEWVALNALIFAHHPEQGRLTVDDLRAREGEPWFDAHDFLVARAPDGRMIGYVWLKVEPDADAGAHASDAEGPIGEIYVVGVHPDFAGRGLGRSLMGAGLRRLRERGCRDAVLYVDASNVGAVHLYRSLGFQTDSTDVQYTRSAPED
jgi:mycothiol synthase